MSVQLIHVLISADDRRTPAHTNYTIGMEEPNHEIGIHTILALLVREREYKMITGI